MAVRLKKNGWALIDTITKGRRVQIQLGQDLTRQEQKDWERTYNFFVESLSLADRNHYADNPKELKSVLSKLVLLDPSQQKKLIEEGLKKPQETQIESGDWATLIKEFRAWEKMSAGLSEDQLAANGRSYDMILRYLESIGCKSYSATTSQTVARYTLWRSHTRRASDVRKSKVVAVSTIKKDLEAWQRLVAWMIGHPDKQMPDRKIFWGVKLPQRTTESEKTIEPLSIDQMEAVLKSLRDYPHQRLHDLVLLAYLTGSELKALDFIRKSYPHCIDSTHNTIKIFKMQVSGQSGGKTDSRGREIPITPTINAILERGHIFGDYNLASYIGNHLRKETRGYEYPKGLRWTMHQLRHTFASHLLQAGVPIEVVSRRCGHSELGITSDVYGRFAQMGIESIKVAHENYLAKINSTYFDE